MQKHFRTLKTRQGILPYAFAFNTRFMSALFFYFLLHLLWAQWLHRSQEFWWDWSFRAAVMCVCPCFLWCYTGLTLSLCSQTQLQHTLILWCIDQSKNTCKIVWKICIECTIFLSLPTAGSRTTLLSCKPWLSSPALGICLEEVPCKCR